MSSGSLKRFGIVLTLGISMLSGQVQAYGTMPTLPNFAATPGATNPLVNQENIQMTICRSGYTSTIRPPVSYTDALKKKQLGTLPYSSYGSSDLKLFEEDHLIPLELGGNPTSTKNLWPEPWAGPYGAHIKDLVENKLHSLVCANALSLSDAQSAISTNWYNAYARYVLGQTITNNSQPSAVNSPTPTAEATQAAAEPMPPLPDLTAMLVDQSTVNLKIPSIPGWDFNVMNLSLQVTGATLGTCPTKMAITSLPFTVTCSNLAVKQVWIVGLVGSGDYGKVTPTIEFSKTATISTYPNIVLPTPVTPTPVTPTPVTPTPVTPIAQNPVPISPLSPSQTTQSRPTGSTGLCKDGTFSFSDSHRGMCSGHGGVAQFYP